MKNLTKNEKVLFRLAVLYIITAVCMLFIIKLKH
jgi:hypothetical protein